MAFQFTHKANQHLIPLLNLTTKQVLDSKNMFPYENKKQLQQSNMFMFKSCNLINYNHDICGFHI